MTGRVGCIVIAALALLVGPAAAQQAPKTVDPKVPAAPAATGPAAKGPQQAGPASTIAVPPPEVLLVLVRSAIIALDHANRTDNYTVFRELGGPGLQRHSSAQLRTVFASLRQQQEVDLLVVAILTPQLTQAPSVSPEGLLQLVGFFPTQPRQIQFHIVYQPAAGQWRLFGLNVTLSGAPQASATAAPQPTSPRAGAPADALPPPKKK